MKPLTPHLVRFGSNFSQIEVTAEQLENAPSSEVLFFLLHFSQRRRFVEGVNSHPEMQYVLVQFSTPEKTREVFSKIQKNQKSLNYYACVTLLNVMPNLRQMATIQRHDQKQSFEDLRSRLSQFGPIVSLTRSQRRESGNLHSHYQIAKSCSLSNFIDFVASLDSDASKIFACLNNSNLKNKQVDAFCGVLISFCLR